MTELVLVGFFAGLALAIPVGPMAIMLVNTTISRGWRHGSVGALGMSTVDFAYALVVFLAGQLISGFLGEYGAALGLVGGAILLWLGLQTLVKNLRLIGKPDEETSEGVGGKTRLATYAIFVGATALNPPTALYFLAIAPSLADLSGDAWAPLYFAGGVFFGSIIWQEALALTGLGLRKITSNQIRPWIGAIGGTLIIALAVKVALDALA